MAMRPVLLNGGFKKHIPSSAYKRSRGLVLLEILQAVMHVQYFKQMDLGEIEPFTLVLLENNHLYECRWDGSKKYYRNFQ
jgi:hypothetical protein